MFYEAKLLNPAPLDVQIYDFACHVSQTIALIKYPRSDGAGRQIGRQLPLSGFH